MRMLLRRLLLTPLGCNWSLAIPSFVTLEGEIRIRWLANRK
jgi:hypothetical protein